MIRRKPQTSSAAVVWPYTPEPSPTLLPSVLPFEVGDDFRMSSEEPSRARPISMAARREGLVSPGARPTLEDVLHNTAPPPYTLAAYTAFLSQQHCLETLEFTTEARKYAVKYDEAAAHLAGMPLDIESNEGFELIQDWTRLLDIYVKPGAPREINLPAEERDDLIDFPYDPKPPPPEALDASVKRMYDLMSDSIFIPFCNSLKVVPYAQTYNALSDFSNQQEQMEPSRLTFDERSAMQRHIPTRRRRSPPTTSSESNSNFQPSRSPPSQHRPTQSSSLSSQLGRQSGGRLSTHLSHSSAVSESALTDSSGGVESPPAGDQDIVMTPPTTPPMSDMGSPSAGHYGSVTSVPLHKARTDSGGWKRMGMKIFGGNKNGGTKKPRSITDQRRDES